MENGLLIKGDRICIPPELYERMLHDLHEGHKGIEKNATPHLQQNLLARYGCRYNRICAKLQNMYQT